MKISSLYVINIKKLFAEIKKPPCGGLILDGVAGLEPANGRIKICRLTNLSTPQLKKQMVGYLKKTKKTIILSMLRPFKVYFLSLNRSKRVY